MSKKFYSLSIWQQILVCVRLCERIKMRNQDTFNEMVDSVIDEMDKVFKESSLNLKTLIIRKLKNLLFL
ncbi:hypothetical protein WN50_09870 [Limnoraphis robusta CS-951]|uniref:Uncharacterized protein n=1 Tax=Limnoraphis robusta CS-951 TaxID=1637645 RepID=A0A0F5YH68_9CYAN|nr:hypothetical protein WN50_09870 [Limnoraphis robusta CS-951]